MLRRGKPCVTDKIRYQPFAFRRFALILTAKAFGYQGGNANRLKLIPHIQKRKEKIAALFSAKRKAVPYIKALCFAALPVLKHHLIMILYLLAAGKVAHKIQQKAYVISALLERLIFRLKLAARKRRAAFSLPSNLLQNFGCRFFHTFLQHAAGRSSHHFPAAPVCGIFFGTFAPCAERFLFPPDSSLYLFPSSGKGANISSSLSGCNASFSFRPDYRLGKKSSVSLMLTTSQLSSA